MLSRVAIVLCLGFGLTSAVLAASSFKASARRVTHAVALAGGPRHIVQTWVGEPLRRAWADATNPRDQKPRLY